MRIVSLLSTLLVGAMPLVASADTGSLPNGATITFNREFLFEVANSATDGGTKGAQPLKLPDSLWTYFNYAHCECASPTYIHTDTTGLDNVSDPSHAETKFGYELLLQQGTTPVHLPMQIFTGTMCDTTDLPTRGSNCSDVGAVADINSLYPTGATPLINIFDLLTPEPAQHATGECLQRSLAGDEWLAASTDMSGNFDFWQSKEVDGDTLPPPVPTVIRASGGENAINLSWDMPSGDISDIYYYQALCIDDSGNAAREPAASPLFQTPRSLCGAPITIQFSGATPTITNGDAGGAAIVDGGIDAAAAFAGSDAATGSDAGSGSDAGIPVGIDAGGVVTPQPIADLDPAYICASTTTATATSLRIDGLTNGAHYHVALLAIDKSGNPAGVYLDATFTPQAVTDFWEDLHNRGSHVEGGFCLINDTFGDDSGISSELRAFRDDTLASTAFGRWLIDVYYADVAGLGEYVHGSTALRIAVGVQLLPAIGLAIAWHHLTLPGLLALVGVLLLARNRRRVLARRAVRVALTSSAALAALFALPHRASADPDPVPDPAQDPDWQHSAQPPAGPADPDWMHQGPAATTPPPDPVTEPSPVTQPVATDALGESEAVSDQPSPVRWHAGIRVGPYTPQIDAQLGGASPGPYKQMFGGYSILPMLDVDRVVYHGLGGVVTAGLSVGYISKTANAFTDTSMPTDPNRQRAGDTNSFLLIPVAAEVGYRLTYLDDELGVPIIPYARGGLAYDIWWVKAPSGDFAQVCKGGGTEPSCTQNKAAGASAGLTMSLGLAVRAERLDPNTAAAMRSSGIQHAGFFVEVSAAKVDGFGSSTKLSVGDNTFFGGVDFEF